MGVVTGTAPTTTPATPPVSPALPISGTLPAGLGVDRLLALLRAHLLTLPITDLIRQSTLSISDEGWTEALDPLSPEGGLNRHLQWFASLRTSTPDAVRVPMAMQAHQLRTEIDVVFAFMADASAGYTGDTMERSANAAWLLLRHVLRSPATWAGPDLIAAELVQRYNPAAAPHGRGILVTVTFAFRHREGF